ncbi:MAG: hypothetical protein CM15mP103_10510 [Gammaproteobacteria bacterium]|nr:MAG: hypothetical protein CM15mP103_10510 [Gammaproteobacteria bacterium]
MRGGNIATRGPLWRPRRGSRCRERGFGPLALSANAHRNRGGLPRPLSHRVGALPIQACRYSDGGIRFSGAWKSAARVPCGDDGQYVWGRKSTGEGGFIRTPTSPIGAWAPLVPWLRPAHQIATFGIRVGGLKSSCQRALRAGCLKRGPRSPIFHQLMGGVRSARGLRGRPGAAPTTFVGDVAGVGNPITMYRYRKRRPVR